MIRDESDVKPVSLKVQSSQVELGVLMFLLTVI